MYTQCPDCQTRFRVTAAALRAAHGTVRCGRCGGAFDALPRLSDAVPSARAYPVAMPIELGSSDAFASAGVVDLAPVIEAELARLDQAELARLQATDFDTAGDSTAESTVVLVDEGGAAEDITLEGEEVKFERSAEPLAAASESGEPSADTLVEAPLEDDEEAVIEAEYDLDATDRFEVLRIPPSAYPDPQEAEREFEALVQRLQREFESRTISPEHATESEEETAETVSLAAEPGLDQTAILEPLDEESLERELAARAAPSPPAEPREVPGTPQVPGATEVLETGPAPEAAGLTVAADSPPSAATPWLEYPPVAPPPSTGAADAVPGPVVEEQPLPGPTDASPPEAGAAAAMAADATAAPGREAAVMVPVGERPLSARRWRPPPDELEPETAPARSVAGVLAWTLGSLLLALALGAQVVHHYRQELARDSRFEPVLRTVYERLGMPLPPRWDLSALELRQSGNDAREGGRMVVRAGLTNRASFAQPLPVLRLQLEDRYGVMIAERDFEPVDYLQDPARADRPLAPGESRETELVLADPGTDAVGYRLEVCLRESPTQLRCASSRG
jgi:predicted Zn finger-like uncharacterized protein